MSLKWKLSLLTSGLLLAAVAGFSAALLWSERRSLEESQMRRRAESAAGLAEVCRSAVVNEQDLPLANYLKRLASSDEILEAYCLDTAGRVLGHTDPSRLNSFLPPPPSSRPTVLAEATVAVGQRSLGKVLIFYDKSLLETRLKESLAAARRRLLRVAALVAAAAFVLAFIATAWAVRPVGALVDGVRALASGRLDHQIPIHRRDELGWLASEFNRMAGRLSELDRMKADFVNGVTHDLKSPLTAVKASADNIAAHLEKPSDPRAARESVALIKRNADRLADLITSILEVAKIENGLSLAKTPVDWESLADRVVRAQRPLAEGKGLVLELVAESPVPSFPADEGKLERAMSNLVGNAVKFTEKGSVTVSVGRQDGKASFSVRDTGPGIPAGFREKLFTKFSRVEGRKAEGTGLGLAIVKGIAEAHGGSVAGENDPSGGAVFTLRIPLP